jgi:hypothetical protein
MKKRIGTSIVALSLLGACSSARHGVSSSAWHSAEEEMVRVQIRGEVVHVGEFVIRSQFTQQSILDPTGGFTTVSSKPKSFDLIRNLGGAERVIEIKFKDMPKLRAKGYRFLPGDRIVVHRMM